MKKNIYIVSDLFNPHQLQEGLSQTLDDTGNIELRLEKEAANTMALDPEVLIAIVTATGSGVLALVNGLFSLWKVKQENIRQIKLAEIEAEKAQNLALIEGNNQLKVAELQTKSNEKIAQLEAKLKKDTATIRIKLKDDEIEIPVGELDRIQTQQLEELSIEEVKTVILTKKR